MDSAWERKGGSAWLGRRAQRGNVLMFARKSTACFCLLPCTASKQSSERSGNQMAPGRKRAWGAEPPPPPPPPGGVSEITLGCRCPEKGWQVRSFKSTPLLCHLASPLPFSSPQSLASQHQCHPLEYLQHWQLSEAVLKGKSGWPLQEAENKP